MKAHKIFGIGLSRTGTTSLQFALEQLGFKTFHYPMVIYSDNDYRICDQFEAFCDSPIPLVYPELDRRYPGSKFILTTRNKTAWLDSMEWMLVHGKVKWGWGPVVHRYHQAFYGTKKFNQTILAQKYDEFHQEVADYFQARPRDLLYLNIDQGIDVAQLCEFLDVPPKNIEFPRRNKRKMMPMKRRILYELYSPLRQVADYLKPIIKRNQFKL